MVHVLHTTQILVISRCGFAEDGKEIYTYQELLCTCTATVLLINLLFSDVPVAVAVVVF